MRKTYEQFLTLGPSYYHRYGILPNKSVYKQPFLPDVGFYYTIRFNMFKNLVHFVLDIFTSPCCFNSRIESSATKCTGAGLESSPDVIGMWEVTDIITHSSVESAEDFKR